MKGIIVAALAVGVVLWWVLKMEHRSAAQLCSHIKENMDFESCSYVGWGEGKVTYSCRTKRGPTQSICIVSDSEGEIVGDLRSGSFLKKIKVYDRKGGMEEIDNIAANINRVVKIQNGFAIEMGNNENDDAVSFNKILLVSFDGDLKIEKIKELVGKGYGGFDNPSRKWVIVPEDSESLKLDVYYDYGEKEKSFDIEKELKKFPQFDASMWLSSGNISNSENKEFTLQFWKEGVTKSKAGPFETFVVSMETGEVRYVGKRY